MQLPSGRVDHTCRLNVRVLLATAVEVSTAFRSMYLLKKSLGVRAVADFEFHMCPNQHWCATFEPLARKGWQRDRNVVCQQFQCFCTASAIPMPCWTPLP